MRNFSSWRKYATRAKGSIRPEFALASVANARYRVALGLRSVEIDGLSPSTADGYFQGLRVTLAYTAAEALAVAIDHHRFPINDSALAERFRDSRHSDLADALVGSLKNKEESRHAKSLRHFFSSRSNDLHPVAYAVRRLSGEFLLTSGRGLSQIPVQDDWEF